MATITIRPIEVAFTISGNAPQTLPHPEAANSTFKKGAIVTKDGNGRVIESTSPNPVAIMGVSEADAFNDPVAGNSNTRVLVANDDTIFKANVSTGQTTALTDLGGIYGLVKVGNNWCVDKTAIGASGRVIVVGFHPDDAIGDVQARLLVTFRSNFSLLSSTS